MGETYDAGTLTAELGLDASKLTAGVKDAKKGLEDVEKSADETSEALKKLAEIGEALGLAEAFHLIKEGASECLMEFDANTRSLRAMSAAVSEINVDTFKEMSESLASTSRNSVATEQNAIALASRFGLTDEAIGGLLPQLNKFAEVTGQDMPGSMQRMAMAIESGTTSPRRLGFALTDVQKSAFAAGDQAQRVAVLVEAMGDKMKGVGGSSETAGFAMAKMGNQTGEAMSAIGSLIDQPFAQFFEGITAVVRLFTDAVNAMPDGLKEVLGYVGALGIGLTSMGLAVGSVMKGWSVLSGVMGPLGTTVLPLVSGGLTTVLTRLAMMMAPIAAAAVAVTALATAYGIFRNALDGKVSTNFLDVLKDGLARAKEDMGNFFEGMKKEIDVEVKMALVPIVQGMDFGQEEKTPGFERKDDAFDSLNKHMNAKGVDTSEVGKYASANTGGVNIGGTMDFGKDIEDWKKSVNDAVSAWVTSNNSSIDANSDLQTQIAKLKDAQIAAQDDADANVQANANEAGGIFTQALAGYNIGNTADQNKAAMSGATTGQQVAGGAIQGVASAAGGSVGAAAGIVGSAVTGNVAGVAQGAIQLLSLSTSFATIMKQLNAIITIIMQAVNPILNILIPALNVVMQIMTSVIKSVIAILTPIMAPIQKIITTILLVIQPFITLVTEIVTVFMSFDPALKLLEEAVNLIGEALMWVAGVIVNDVVNPIIEAWNWMIDGIDELLGWIGIDLSSLKLQTLSLNQNVDAVDAVTNSMNDLDQSSQNIPEGFKVALSAYNASAVLNTPGSTTSSTAQSASATSILGQVQSMFGGNTGGASFTGSGAVANIASITPAQWAAAGYGPGASSNSKMATNTSNLNIQNVTVQATSSDLIKQIQNGLKMQGYLKSGTPLVASTNRSQYGAA